MKKKFILFSMLIPFLAFGSIFGGQKSSKAAEAATGAIPLWKEDFSTKSEGESFGNYVVREMNGIKWAKDENGSLGVDLPAYSHSADFSFSYLAFYDSTKDGYNYVEFRDALGSGRNVEFSLHSCGVMYTQFKSPDIEYGRSWQDPDTHYASAYYGTNEYNSIRFVKKGTKLAIYINGARTSYYDFGVSGTTTSIYFADYNLPGSYYTNFVYENWNGVDFAMDDYYETFENFASGVNYRSNGDSWIIENHMLKSTNPSAGNTNYLALMLNDANTVIDFDLKVDSLDAASKYFYFIIGEQGQSNYYEYSIEANTSGSWFICKYNRNVVYHSGNTGTNPVINVGGMNHVKLVLARDHAIMYFNDSLVGVINGLIGAFSYVSFNAYCAGTIFGVTNISMRRIDNVTNADTFVTSFMTTTGVECAALDVKPATWLGLKSDFEALGKETRDYIYHRVKNDETGSYKDLNDRYSLIVNKYGYNAFIKNSLGSPLAFFNTNNFVLASDPDMLVYVISGLAIVSLLTLVIIIRRRKSII